MKKILLNYLLFNLLIFFLSAYGIVYGFDACDDVAYMDSLGGYAKGDPIIKWFDNRFIIATRGRDDKVWVKEWNNGALSEWYVVNNGITAGNLKMAVENGKLMLYVQGSDGYIYKTQYYNSQHWLDWQRTDQDNSNFGNAGSNISENYKVYTIGSNRIVKIGKCVSMASPSWTKNLIIYEIPTKEFTSPNGAETGNFQGVKNKMSYLADLGITGIWLTGHSLSKAHHFFNIWTQYACIRPDVFDPTLGSEQDFRDMISEAHKYGIKIFLDVITHGITDDSPLISQHQKWFQGNSWRMADYDWNNVNGDQKELEDWWVNIWTNYVANYDIDGYRLDLGHNRHDLWARIKNNAEKANHPIFIVTEAADSGLSTGVYDIWEHDKGFVVDGDGANLTSGSHTFQIIYSDGSKSNTGMFYIDEPQNISSNTVYGIYHGRDIDKVGEYNLIPDGRLDNHVTIKGFNKSKAIENIIISASNGEWQYNKSSGKWLIAYEKQNDKIEAYFSFYDNEPDFNDLRRYYGQWISCHDHGSYALQGSRFLAGYSLFLPTIPILVAGEEFNNTYTSVPNKSACLYGANPTIDSNWCGGWLYASQLQWDDLNNNVNKSFNDDFKKILSIRKNEVSLNYFASFFKNANVISINDFQASISAPRPYMRWYNDEAILIIGNNNKQIPLTIMINLNSALQKINLANKNYYKIKDLWTGEERTIGEADLQMFTSEVGQDNFKIYKIIPSQETCASKTCTILGNYQCGSWPDGCGNTLNCGTCVSGKTCNNGKCVSSGSGGGGGGGVSSSSSITKSATKLTRAEILQKINEIIALINKLKAQLAAITGKPLYSCAKITQTMFYGKQNDTVQVKCLQEVLQSQGYAVTASGAYDLSTKTAVKQFQEKYAKDILVPYGLKYGSGNVGNATMQKINSFISY